MCFIKDGPESPVRADVVGILELNFGKNTKYSNYMVMRSNQNGIPLVSLWHEL